MTAPETVTLHHPVIAGVTTTVTGKAKAAEWRKQGWCDQPPSRPGAAATEQHDAPAGEPDASWTVAQLRAHAEQLDVDVSTAKTKDQILAALAGPEPDATA
ncbi:hypothetical protein MHY85_03115 [Cellulomonas sp. ACRRI]|uniref:hypothetical protein n=1 Tax=Cellulomonas sp. ACRRI TaxID=2918188 RepID=UPI001EF3D5C9|nr:hypothetical protein [Cellulomonas sp. ACRRI]MCG7284962.1 hypothetical protein [Cellulomonas sp. ACRRI]